VQKLPIAAILLQFFAVQKLPQKPFYFYGLRPHDNLAIAAF